jgi:hypothetical protein
MGMLSKIFCEYPYGSAGTKKAMDTSDIYWNRPVLYSLYFGFMGDTAFVVAPLPEDNDGWDT